MSNLDGLEHWLFVESSNRRVETPILDRLAKVPSVVMLEEEKMSKSRRNTPRDDQAHVQVVPLEVIGFANTAVEREAGNRILTLLKVKR